MKNRKITFFSSGIITLVIILGLIYSYHNNKLIKDTTGTLDESKYMYANFLKKDDSDTIYNVSFIIPKGYEYEKFEGDYIDEVYSMTLLSDENDINSFRTSACISIEYILNKENIERTILFPENRVETYYTRFIKLSNVPPSIIELKLLSREYIEFREKQYLLFIETEKYLMCFNIDLPYRGQYSTEEGIITYFEELLQSLKIERFYNATS